MQHLLVVSLRADLVRDQPVLEVLGLLGIRSTALEECRLRLLISRRFPVVILELIHEVLAFLAGSVLVLH